MDASAATAYGLAEQTFEDWLSDHSRCGWARAHENGTAKLRNKSLGRVAAILGHPSPCAATRRWVGDIIQAWAPLEILFPTQNYPAENGVSGELADHVPEIVEREYGFLLSAQTNAAGAADLLHADAQRLGLDLALGTALLGGLRDESQDNRWITAYTTMSLALAEYLHRQALGMHQLLTEAMAMSYTATVALQRRQLHAACRMTPCIVAATSARYA
jgi:hypothetical protein